MPELPEVEVICRGIRPHLLWRRVVGVTASGKKLRLPLPMEQMQRDLVGRTILSLERRAKYLQVGLDDGAMLVIHLGMTGNLGLYAPQLPASKHTHVRWLLDSGLELRFRDSRRFGSVIMLNPNQAACREETVFAMVGPEPFSPAFNASAMYKMARNRSVAIKPFLMNSATVAGVGNIYANEALFAATISPTTPAKRISRKRWQRLINSIRAVLAEAIACGGSSISDFVNAEQDRGYFQIRFQVYNRSGEPCRRCQGTIRKRIIGGRASYYCPGCQR